MRDISEIVQDDQGLYNQHDVLTEVELSLSSLCRASVVVRYETRSNMFVLYVIVHKCFMLIFWDPINMQTQTLKLLQLSVTD